MIGENYLLPNARFGPQLIPGRSILYRVLRILVRRHYDAFPRVDIYLASIDGSDRARRKFILVKSRLRTLHWNLVFGVGWLDPHLEPTPIRLPDPGEQPILPGIV